MSNFCLIAIKQKLDIVVHFKTVITHKHKYKTNFAHFVFIEPFLRFKPDHLVFFKKKVPILRFIHDTS